jgi:hypothetical protein
VKNWCLPIAIALVVLGACDSTEPRVPGSIEADRLSIAMDVGDTVRIEAVILDQNGRAFDIPPAGHSITWSSSNPGVATVNAGLVRGVSNGSATITVSAGALPSVQVPVEVRLRTVTMQLGFAYSGDRAGSFSVAETRRLDQVDWQGNWAVSFHDDDYGSHDIIAQRRRTDGRYDFIYFWIDGEPITTTGNRAISAGFMILGFNSQNETWEAAYSASAGNANFSVATAQQVAGTFSLTMVEEESAATLSVSSGTFDVPFLSDAELSAEPAAADAAGRGIDLPRPLRLRIESRR